ncbi:hypothetical protein SAY87_028358 [Trapa incisa]|uniref:TFIIS N-terminal domain-containing protein n=1 Tax=Trapa incisa TaxID=236973 RepID=A0AAN7KXP9_9MYRT|nr:hypothetical protein SAY87_028358 [Trapa incisa]
MHSSDQSNGRSPRNTSSLMPASQLKPGVDSLQSSSPLPSQSKGKKRERPDQSIESVKRERTSKVGDDDSCCLNSESLLKSEIAKVVERGPLVDIEGVERLVQVMLVEINEKKIDLSYRTMLANIIVTTEKSDCLSRFVQIRGLSVLDDWLQDIHKRKTGSPKDNDKAAEEFLLVLLHALDKLPVNLPALQLCNIGKSVNHLRTHKNLEIQKKARSLVDTWKKRVEAEMNINDAKMGSNQAGAGSVRSRPPEVSHVNRNTGGSSEYAPKSPSVQQSTSKTAPAKFLQGETASKSVSQFQGSMKLVSLQGSAGATLKDGPPQITSSSSDVPMTTSRDEKSCSSSPSNNSSLSCSGDQVKNGGSSLKEETRSSGSASNKMSSSASRHRRSVNGLLMSVTSARETATSRTVSMHKNAIPDIASQSGIISEKSADVAPEVNSHKFIVKIPNRSRSPAQRAVRGSADDACAANSGPSSPAPLEQHDQLDAGIEDRADASQANASLDGNAECWQGNDFRDNLNPNGRSDGPVDPALSDDHLSVGGNIKKFPVLSRSSISSPRNALKIAKVPEALVDPMNALIESCIIKEEANVPVPIGDDVGMHLLASVAAGEMFKSELAPPADSPHGEPSVVEPSSRGNGSEMKPLPLDSLSRDDDMSKHVGSDYTQKGQFAGDATISSKGGGKTPLCSVKLPVEGQGIHLSSSSMEMMQHVVPSPESNKVKNALEISVSDVKIKIHSEDGQSKARVIQEMPLLDETQETKIKADSSISPVNIVRDGLTGLKSEVGYGGGVLYVREGKKTEGDPDHSGQLEAKPNEKSLFTANDEKQLTIDDELKAAVALEMDAEGKINKNEKPDTSTTLEVQVVSCNKERVEGEMVTEEIISEPVSKQLLDRPLQDMNVKQKSRGCEVPNVKEADDMEACNSTGACASLADVSHRNSKLEFDLNEGLNTDDNKFGELMNFSASSSPVTLPLVSPLPAPVPFSSISLATPIAVTAAAAKGPFVHPDDLLRAKVEIGWKGSAATSAFRPAEPRKALDLPVNTVNATQSPDVSLAKSRPVLDFDLNVSVERIVEDAAPQRPSLETVSLSNFRSNVEKKTLHEMPGLAPGRGSESGGLGLDLNCADESSTDCANSSISNAQKVDDGTCRDFDLNDEPEVDTSEPSTFAQQLLRSSTLSHQPPASGLRVNGVEMGKISPWFPAGSSYSALSVPSILSDRGEQSFPIVAGVGPPRMVGPSAGVQFGPENYRGPLLSSSPGMPFPSPPFQYSIFPYGTSFPLPSATLPGNPATCIDPSSGGRLGFPPVHSQLMGPAGFVSSHFSRPYMVSLSDGSGNRNFETTKKWNRQGLDLNMGPAGGPELEVRDEASTLGSKQLSIGGSRNLTEDQARMYQVSNGLLKRKDYEGWRDEYRHPSWQQ